MMMTMRRRMMMMMMVVAMVGILILHGQQSAWGLEFNFTEFDGSYTNSPEIVLLGDAFFSSEGGMVLTNRDKASSVGRAFYNAKIPFNSSFSTAFTVRMSPSTADSKGGHGMAFFLTPEISPPPFNSSGGYLGLFNSSTDGAHGTQIYAVEMDTYQNQEFNDINDGHFGTDHNSINSSISSSNRAILRSGGPITVLIVYKYLYGSKDFPNGRGQISVYAAANSQTLTHLGFTDIILPNEEYWEPDFYMGFSAANGEGTFLSQYKILSWAFGADLSYNTTPAGISLPVGAKAGIGVAVFIFIIVCILIFFLIGRRKRSKDEGCLPLVREAEKARRCNRNADDNLSAFCEGVRRFKYSELRIATNNFSEKNLLGRGGFGPVFKGILPPSKNSTIATSPPMAVKCIADNSNQGEREFLAEVTIISRIRHRNLVQLQGWCHEKGKLFLIYDWLPNGSLDQHLFFNNKNKTAEPGKGNQHSASTLDWKIRYKVARGLAAALLYLHEEWEKQVVHRDVKSSNVILDEGFNARLSDFGLARLVEHDMLPQTTRVAGTFGYLAPEVPQTGKSTTASDVYSYGAVALEIVCGRPCLDHKAPPNEVRLVDWVWQLHSQQQGLLLNAVDPRMMEFCKEEVLRLMYLGLACSHPDPSFRPSIRQVHDCLINPTSSIPSIPTTMPLPTYNNSYTITDILTTSTINTQSSTSGLASPDMSVLSSR